ncbi:54S ribosomal protein L20 mitochondrial [Pycnococcus provasolii]|uniref:50S ribosomal protein L20 n=1 Tax=Pycnococcus provasolii TaxID=41880 RepID=A0A6T5WH84_9CHLO|nr:54S ribosomal protein L20 mitochondrial [Pycnococcus provasolii]|mmetsp:Transcript_10191/g.23071  ORF Transcript_10191/g.23071 Transcript_10191/m.23071 type:complete len:113 (-) Transcript_10191:61-399(-)|eukprot:CAMPEP_0119193236 /NCGR_PEP_ID=MMETSP1316-20130426/3475_1 /TAXON_ID=41880 /ORGANISM="Pycnococcus provasolii, Strain RCC2336" /LENGTH=112 /DNA_ID=CAMNT_0007188491 /DNA_START=186 /DNA_END=524 /DNA_ORIENTATION=+
MPINRKRVFEMAKGFYGRRKNCYRITLPAVERALAFSYRDRRTKKRTARTRWIETINAATRQYDVAYSKFMFSLQKQVNSNLDRKSLADLARNEPYSFKAIVEQVKRMGGQI